MTSAKKKEKRESLSSLRRLERARSLEQLAAAIEARDRVIAELSLVHLAIESHRTTLKGTPGGNQARSTSAALLSSHLSARSRTRLRLAQEEAAEQRLTSALAEKTAAVERAKETVANAQRALEALTDSN